MEKQFEMSFILDRHPEQIQSFLMECLDELQAIDFFQAQIMTTDVSSGDRADLVPLIGQAIIEFITSGAAVAFIECIKSWISRDEALIIVLKRADGAALEFSAKNLSSSQIDDMVKSLNALIK